MSNHAAGTTVTVNLKDLERLIRRAVHDEMNKLIKRKSNLFFIDPETPLYEDLAAIARMKKRRKIKVYSRREAFCG